MAKQKFEINTFDKGIISNPSESDIPTNAASFSLNVNPVTEDGTLRGINQDTVLTKTAGWADAAKQVERITILKSATADTDLGVEITGNLVDVNGHPRITCTDDHGLQTDDYVIFEGTAGSGGDSGDIYDNAGNPQRVEVVDSDKFILAEQAFIADDSVTTMNIKIAENATSYLYRSQMIEIKTISTSMYIWFEQGGSGSDPNVGSHDDEEGGDESSGTNFDDYPDANKKKVTIANSASKSTIAAAIHAAIGTVGTIKSTYTATNDYLDIECTRNGEVELMILNPTDPGTFIIDNGILSKSITTEGKGTPFLCDDFILVNESDDIFTLIGVDFSENEIQKWEDIYESAASSSSDDNNRGGSLKTLTNDATNSDIATFAKRDKAVHIGLGSSQTDYTKWVGRVDNTQFDNVYNDWFVENDELKPMSEGLSPVNFDHIATYPSWGTSAGVGSTIAFAENQTHHATVTLPNGTGDQANLNKLFHAGTVFLTGDPNFNRYGKNGTLDSSGSASGGTNQVPKIGWIFAISNTQDTGDAALLAAKNWAYDDDIGLEANDLFMVVDPGTAHDTSPLDAKVEYIGNAGYSPFGYGINEGGRYIYKISMNSAVDGDVYGTVETKATARYRKYDILDSIDESGISTITPCRTPITSGISSGKSDYLVYGDGTIDASHISDQRCRPLYGMWWVSTVAGRLFRVNLMDIDSLNSDEEYTGPKYDCEMTFDYANIARCQENIDNGIFKHWYGGIYGSLRAADSDEHNDFIDTSNENSHFAALHGNDFTGSVTWSRTPVNSKIIGIIETFNNNTEHDTRRGVISEQDNNDRYVYDDDSNKNGDGTEKYGDDTNTNHIDHHHACLHQTDTKDVFASSSLINVKVPWHGLDTGNVITFFKGDSSGNDLGNTNNDGNSIVTRVNGNHDFRCTGTYTDDAASKKGVYHSSKVWILYQNKDGGYYSSWDLMLYNWYPTTVNSSSKVLVYDRTPPYDEVDIGNRTGDINSGADSYFKSNLNSNMQSGSIICQKNSLAFGRNDYVSQNGDYQGNTTGNDPYMYLYQRRDGSTLFAKMNKQALGNASFGRMLGWDGSATTNNPRKMRPLQHTIHHLLEPVEIPETAHTTFTDDTSTDPPNYAELTSDTYSNPKGYKFDGAHLRSGGNKHQVGFLARVSGRMCIDGYACYYRQHEHHNHMDQHYGSFKTYNDDLVQFTVTDTGSAYNDTRTYNGAYDDHEGDRYVATNISSHYSDGGKFKQRAFYDGSSLKYVRGSDESHLYYSPGDKYSSYSGTFLVPNIVPLGNTKSSTESVRQGQIGDYLYIDRKWLSGEPLVGSSGSAVRSDSDPLKNELVWSLKTGVYTYENYGETSASYNIFGGNQRPYTNTSISTKVRGTNGSWWHGSGLAETGSPSSGHSGHYVDSRSINIRQSLFMAQDDETNLDKYVGSGGSYDLYIYDVNRWNMSCETLQKNVCQMKTINEPLGKLAKVRSAHILTNKYFTSLTNEDSTLVLQTGADAREGKNNALFINGSKIGATDYSSVLSLSAHNSDVYDSLDQYYPDRLREINSYDEVLVSKEFPESPKIVSTFWTGSWNNDQETDHTYMFYTGQVGGKTFLAPPASPHGLHLGDNASSAVFKDIASPITSYTTFDSIIDVVTENAGTKKTFKQNQNIKYKLSLLYDGFQDGPLSPFFVDHDMSADAETLTVEVKINLDGGMSKRVTHIVVWRKNTDNELYRMVKQIKLTLDEWNFNQDLGIWVHTFTDSGSFASYSATTGIDEDVETFTLNYGISANINDQLFVGKAYHPEIEDASKYIFKSKPGNWSQFDYSKDYLVLDTRPTAIASYNGKIYVFDRKNIYRINPEQMFVEDTFEGVGCLSQDAFVVTEFGMCFADRNNIYLHDGAKPIPIGTNILNVSHFNGASIGWTKSVQTSEDDYNTPPQVFYDGDTHSFCVFVIGSCDQACAPYVARCWAFSIGRNRWDYWEAPEVSKVAAGKDGDILIAGRNGNQSNRLLHNYKDSSQTREFRWLSKQLSITKSIDNKRFHRIKLNGNVIASTISSPAKWKDDIVVYVDGKIQDLTKLNSHYTQSATGAYTETDHNNSTQSINYIGRNNGDVYGDTPKVGSYIKIQDEIMKVTAVDTTTRTLTVDRAQLGTTATTHNMDDAPGDGSEGYEGHALYNIAPTLKLPAKCKGKNIQVMIRNQTSFVDSFGIEFISRNTK